MRQRHTVFDHCEHPRSPAPLIWADFGVPLVTLGSFEFFRGAQHLPFDVLWLTLAPLGSLWLPMGSPLRSLWGHFGVTFRSFGALWRNFGAGGWQKTLKSRKHVFLCVFACLWQMCLICCVFVCFLRGPKNRQSRLSRNTRVFVCFCTFGRFRGQNSFEPKHTCFCVFLSRMNFRFRGLHVFLRAFRGPSSREALKSRGPLCKH